MILPKGDFKGIHRGKPVEYVDRVRNGYLKISWKDSNEIYLATLVVENNSVVMAEVEFVKSRKTLKGNEALELISNLDYAVVEVYSLDSRSLQSIYTMNDESYLIKSTETEVERKEEEEKAEYKEIEEKVVTEKVVTEVDNFENFILNLKDFSDVVNTNFSGIVKGIGKDRTATVYLKNGRVVGARVVMDGEEFEGPSALYYLDFPAKVVLKELEDVNVDESARVEISLDKSEIIKKYNIKIPDKKEIEEVLSVLNELKFEKERFVDKFKKFFKKI